MKVNARKPVVLVNKTNYWNPETNRSHVHISSPNAYQSRRAKIEGYENRLYWEYKYCEDHNGQTFFYTLTYNDANIPTYEGHNCFDYNDLVYLLNGGFKKQLLRKYGTNFKYFVGAELGDGKGKRGMQNNPHYHVLFFLRSAEDERYEYKPIDPLDFRHLVRKYWQGFDEDKDGFCDYRTAKFGIAREGENIGKVDNFRACTYCAKYVCKDAKLKSNEAKIRKKLEFRYFRELKDLNSTKEGFYDDVINPRFNIPTKCHLDEKHQDWQMSPFEIYKAIAPNLYQVYYSVHGDAQCAKAQVVDDIVEECNLLPDYKAYVQKLVDEKVRLDMNEYRNRYCNKCRISQGVGDYALDFIQDPLDPSIQIPSKKGFKNRPIGMYYYRKLYTDVVYDTEGQPLRVLNELGKKYKMANLPKQLQRLRDRTAANLTILTPALYEDMVHSDVNTNVFMTYDRYRELIDSVNIEKLVKKYAEFKLVYEDRFFSLVADPDTNGYTFPRVDIANDYQRFLEPSYYTTDRNPYGVTDFLKNDFEGYISYYAHPYFLRYISLFSVLDLLADYLFVQGDIVAQQEAEKIQEVKRFHDKLKLEQFYKNYISA